MPSQVNAELLERVAGAFGRSLSGDERSGLERFFELLLTWNARINLTGASSFAQLAQDHLPDALALCQVVPSSSSVVDVGTGGGLPALPFLILRPDVRLTLVEPRAKRAAFLRAALRELGREARVEPTRAEALVEPAFDVATSRATFPPEEWVRVGARLVRPGGRVVLFLGEEVPGSLAGDATIRVNYQLPDGRRRAILAIDVPRGTAAPGGP